MSRWQRCLRIICCIITIVEDDDFWKLFPKEYAQKFRELHEKTKYNIFEEIAKQIEK